MKNVLFIAVLFFVASCVRSEMGFSVKNIKESRDGIEVDISYLVADDDTEFAKNFNVRNLDLNTIVERFIVENSIKNLKEFLEDSDAEEAYFAQTPFYWHQADTLSLLSPNLVSMKTAKDVYTGGAHPLYSIMFSNFDGKTGQYLFKEDLFTDIEAVRRIAEKHFRKHFKMDDNQDINNDGNFWFTDGFQLSDNIGFDDKNLILYYNPYEIAAYAFGPTEILIPISEIKDYLKI